MATLKYYFLIEESTPTPAYSATWNDSAHAGLRYTLLTTKSDAAEGGANNDWFTPAGSGEKSLIKQFVTPTAPGAIDWTTADTFSMSIKCAEGNAAYNDTLYAVIRVVSADGGTFRGTLFDGQVNATEFPTADYISRHCDGVAVQNNVTQQATDLIVVELGVLRDSASAGYSVIRIADVIANPDLDLSDVDTSGNPWIEFTYAAGGGITLPLTGVSG